MFDPLHQVDMNIFLVLFYSNLRLKSSVNILRVTDFCFFSCGFLRAEVSPFQSCMISYLQRQYFIWRCPRSHLALLVEWSSPNFTHLSLNAQRFWLCPYGCQLQHLTLFFLPLRINCYIAPHRLLARRHENLLCDALIEKLSFYLIFICFRRQISSYRLELPVLGKWNVQCSLLLIENIFFFSLLQSNLVKRKKQIPSLVVVVLRNQITDLYNLSTHTFILIRMLPSYNGWNSRISLQSSEGFHLHLLKDLDHLNPLLYYSLSRFSFVSWRELITTSESFCYSPLNLLQEETSRMFMGRSLKVFYQFYLCSNASGSNSC